MASRRQREEAAQSISGLLAPAFAMWNPVFAGTARWNAQAREGFRAVAGEWQEFVDHRLQEDVHLMQRLQRSRTPDQFLTAYADYWSKAVEQYGKEVATMTKLMAGTTNKMVAVVQSTAAEASKGGARERA